MATPRKKASSSDTNPWEETASSPNSKKEKLSLKKNKAEEVRPDNKGAENQGIGFGFDTIKSFFGVGAGKSSKEEKRPRVEKPLPPRRDTRETLRTPQLNAVNALFFFAFAVGGSLLMSLVKVLFIGEGTQGYGGGSLFLSIIIPLLILLGYAFCCEIYKGLSTRRDQIGDNLYYLGFIFTLSSLAISLVVSDRAFILNNFGLAIWSTLWGIVLRTVYNQLRFDPDDVEEASRLELSEASTRVRVEIDKAVRSFEDYRRASQQMINEGFKETKENIDEISEQLLKSVEATAQGASKPIEDMVRTSVKASEEMSQRMVKFTENTERFNQRQEKLLEATQNMSDAMAKFSDEYKSTDTIGKSIQQGVEKTIIDTTAKQEAALDALKAQMEATRKRASAARAKRETKGQPEIVRRRGKIFRFFFGE